MALSYYRLLYGHMMQTGHGPARGMTRRKIVLRFLSNCEGSIDELCALILVPFRQLMGLCTFVCAYVCYISVYCCMCVHMCVLLCVPVCVHVLYVRVYMRQC